jgi:formate-dependent nitrite reductase membrane component NrfD
MTVSEPLERGWRSDSREPGYYGAPIVKPAPWKNEIAAYFFTGGLAGASSVLAVTARLAGRPALARHARRWAVAGLAPSPVLLVVDLGRPERFANMLRVLKPTSPMSVGSWLLAVYGPTATAASLLGASRRLPRLGLALDLTAGVLGSALTTYTAVLVSDTATPVWHESRRELPFLFAASAAASGGAASGLTVPPAEAGPAHLLASGAAVAEIAVTRLMERRLGPLAASRHEGKAGALGRASQALSLSGAVLTLASRRRRWASRVGGVAVLAGALTQRLCVLHSGKQSAADPRQALP